MKLIQWVGRFIHFVGSEATSVDGSLVHYWQKTTEEGFIFESYFSIRNPFNTLGGTTKCEMLETKHENGRKLLSLKFFESVKQNLAPKNLYPSKNAGL
jgi:hypothetical protein